MRGELESAPRRPGPARGAAGVDSPGRPARPARVGGRPPQPRHPPDPPPVRRHRDRRRRAHRRAAPGDPADADRRVAARDRDARAARCAHAEPARCPGGQVASRARAPADPLRPALAGAAHGVSVASERGSGVDEDLQRAAAAGVGLVGATLAAHILIFAARTGRRRRPRRCADGGRGGGGRRAVGAVPDRHARLTAFPHGADARDVAGTPPRTGGKFADG